MGARAATTDLVMRGMNGVHRLVLAVSGGHVGRKLGRMKVVELHTVGRLSGKARSTMLTAPVVNSRGFVLVASKGGSDADPQWYRNLRANPEVELTVDGKRQQFTCRTATPAEKADLWPAIVAAYPGYARYQRKTERDISVVLCEYRNAGNDG